jgi:hypothetical protein
MRNLQNFPETPVCRTEEDRTQLFIRTMKWKIDFEEQLRVTRAYLWDEYQHLPIPCPQGPMLRRWINWIDNEVLGVEPKIKEEMKR